MRFATGIDEKGVDSSGQWGMIETFRFINNI
jgi:hypothetical protein